MIKTKICKGDKVVVFRGEGRYLVAKGKSLVCEVIKVDRVKGLAHLEVPRVKAKRGEREVPLRGVEAWKTVRYNPKSGEAGGLKILKRPIQVANLKIVEQGPRRDWKSDAK